MGYHEIKFSTQKCAISEKIRVWLEIKMYATLYIGLTSEKYKLCLLGRVDVIVPATS